jgi:hypothetical protein
MFILKISHIFPNTFKILWGNRFITFEFFFFFFKEWINSGIFFANDIIDNNGKITQEFILHKLKNKSNWISEFSILIKAFPQKLHKLFPTIFRLESKTLFGIIKLKSFHLNILSLFSSRNLKMKKYRLLVFGFSDNTK